MQDGTGDKRWGDIRLVETPPLSSLAIGACCLSTMSPLADFLLQFQPNYGTEGAISLILLRLSWILEKAASTSPQRKWVPID